MRCILYDVFAPSVNKNLLLKLLAY